MKRWSISSHHFTVILLTVTLFLLSPVYGNLEVAPVEDYLCSGAEGGPFAPAQKVYTLANQGAAAITWGVNESAGWIDCLPQWGTIGAGETVDVTVSMTSAAESLAEGEYSETLTFTDITNTVEITRQVILTVEGISLEPVAWWKMDGDATDSSGNGYDGTVNGDPNWIAGGVYGGALEFDGDDYVEIGDYTGISGTHARTIAAWIKTSDHDGLGTIVQWGTDDYGKYWLFRITPSWKDDNTNPGQLDDTVMISNWGFEVYSTTKVVDGEWHHVAVVLEEGESDIRNVKLYIDGTLDTTVLGDFTQYEIDTLLSVPVQIGAARRYNNNDRVDFFDGCIDDVRIYDHALSQGEIEKVAWGGPLIVQPSGSFDASGEPGGPFMPGYKDYTLKNLGEESLYWGIDALPDWLDVDSSFGSLDPNETAVVRVFLTEEAELFDEGLYTAAVTFNNLSQTQDSVTREVNLDIQTIRGIWTDPESFDVTLTEGAEQPEVLTIGTDGTETVNFTLRSRTVSGPASAVNRTMALDNALRVAPPQKMVFDPQQAVSYEHTPDQLLVRFVPSDQQNLVRGVQQQKLLGVSSSAQVIQQYRTVPGLSLVQIGGGVTVEEALAALNAREDVLYAQPNYRVHAYSVFPNDARFNDLWGLHNTGQSGGLVNADIDMPQAWEISTGSDSVVVAVIDTGIDYNHEDLAGNMWINQAEYNGASGVDDDGNGYVDDIYGYDFVNNDGNPMDDHYHGTHCAGTIGAVGNNGIGVTGVCWDVKLMAVKFLGSGGSGSTSDAIASVEYATLMGVDVMSNSWGGGSFSQGLKDAIDAAGTAGIAFVAAAGNDSADNDRYPHYPSSYTSSNIIAVMSTTDEDQRSGFTCWGLTSVDIGAPGSSILSCEPGNRYQYLSGTSMACPHVAGACALLRSVSPALSVPEIKEILFNTADAIPALAGRCVSEGRLNVNGAMQETAVPWIEFDIEQGTVGPDQTVEVAVTFNAAELAPGQYHAEIMVVSDDPARPQLTIPVTLTVVPDPLEVTPEAVFDPNGLEGGPFEPDSTIYTLSNVGTESLDWSVDWQADWLTIEPASGTLGVGEHVEVLVSLNTNVLTLAPELYEDEILFNNLTVGGVRKRAVMLSVRPPDKFTQMFDGDTESLQNASITFRPDGSTAYYAACVAKESVGGFEIGSQEGTFVPIGDDDYAEISFADGKQFDFYGIAYDRVYIGSNGYLTFGQGDVEFDAMLEYHFGLPRISGLFADLTPADNQSISYVQTNDRFAVTYQEVPVFGDKTAANTFRIELFFADGAIRMSYLNLDAYAVIAGLSDGRGMPGFFEESDLLSYLNCCDCGDTDGDGGVGLSDLCDFALVWLQAECAGPEWCQRADFDRSGRVDLLDWRMMSENWQKVEYAWSEPQFLLELNGKVWSQPHNYSELDDGQGNKARAAGLSHDLLTIFYGRYVPDLGIHCLFQSTRSDKDESFGNERRLDELMQTGGHLQGPWLSADGQRLYYHEKHTDVNETFMKMASWSSGDGRWVHEDTFDELHVAGYNDYRPTLTDDELVIFWNSTMTNSIWTASRVSKDEPFGNLQQLSEITEPLIDGASSPSVLPDGLTLYFHMTPSGESNPAFFKITRNSSSESFGNLERIDFPDSEKTWELNCYVSPDETTIFYQSGDAFEHGSIWATTFGPSSNDLYAKNVYFCPDGLTLFTGRIGGPLSPCIVEYRRESESTVFEEVRVLEELGQANAPWVSADGLQMYYHTVSSGLWVASRETVSQTWTPTRQLSELDGDYVPTLSEDELTIVYTRYLSPGNHTLMIATRNSIEEPFSNVRHLSELDMANTETCGQLTADGLMIYFASNANNVNRYSIYKAERNSLTEPFGNIQKIEDIGVGPNLFVMPDEQTMYFYDESSAEPQKGIWKKVWVPVQESCLPR